MLADELLHLGPTEGDPRMRMAVSPWGRLNLRRNPFGEPAAEEVGCMVVAPELKGLVDVLRRPRSAVQVLGEAGRGKTARLRALEHRFPGVPYAYLPEDGPLPRLSAVASSASGSPVLLLDEAQRLPRRRRRRLFRAVARRGASLALGSHEDLEPEMEAAGLSVETVVVRGLGPTRLASIIERRIEWARAGAGSLPRIDPAECRDLLGRFGDDLRAILDHLYEIYQARLIRITHGDHNRCPSAS